MAYPTAVNGQITDAVSQSTVTNLGAAPTVARGTLMQSLAHGQALLVANATARQQNGQTVADAAMTAAIRLLWANDGKDESGG